MADVTSKPLRYLLQAINYSVFMGLIWYFASAPSVRLIAEDEAMITIAFAHAGQLREPCRRLSQEELNKLPPNMRKIDDCPRERSAVTIEALLDGLDINPLPASLEISLRDDRRSAEGMEAVANAIEGLAGVESLSSGRDWVEGYLRAVALVRGVGVGLGIILALATLLIVANTIRLGVFARRDELEILSLVGASRPFVQTPFLLEGLVQGAAGGAIALGLLYALFRLVLPGFEFGLELLVGTAPRFFSLGEALILVAGGAGLGLFGSAAALSGGWRP